MDFIRPRQRPIPRCRQQNPLYSLMSIGDFPLLSLPICGKDCIVGAMHFTWNLEVLMSNEHPPERKKKKSGGGGFVFYALFVFTALAVGLVVILMRSKGY